MTPLLKGIRIVEVGAVVLGPYAGQLLADLGAEVIKVEPPEGDIARDSHPKAQSGGSLFVNNNRNKKMLAVDLKQREGRATLSRLIADADVLMHNMRMEAAERLELGFEAVAAVNPRIIYCAAIGFGQGGRYRRRPAFDDIIQAASGIAGLAAATGGAPRFVPTILADKVAALHAVYGVLAALVARANGREGAICVEVPMFEALVAFLLNEHLAEATFDEAGRTGYPRVLSPNRRPFRTADGWIAVLPYTTQQWLRFFEEIGRRDVSAEAWFQDPATRQSRIEELYAMVAESLPERTTADWIAALEARDVPCSMVNGMDDLLADPHLADVDFFAVPEGFPEGIVRALPQPVIFQGIEKGPDAPPGAIGADTREILKQCGLDIAAIDALIAAGVVRDGA